MESRLSRRTARNTLAKRCRFNENLFIELRVKWEIPRAVRPAGGKTGLDRLRKMGPKTPRSGSKRKAIPLQADFRCIFRHLRALADWPACWGDRQSTRLNSSHVRISYAVFCL